MNIIIINHYAGSIIHGMEYRPFYLAREWVKLGHEVTIIAASAAHLRSKDPNCNPAVLTEEIIEGIRYVWVKTPKYNGNGIGRVVNMLTFVYRLLRFGAKINASYQPDVVIASSTYPLDIYPSRRIANKNNAKLIFEVHDLWPLSPMELGKMSPYHPFIASMQAAENYAYKNADKVVSLLPAAKEHMEQHYMEPEKFNYIPNGIDIAEWENSSDVIPDTHSEIIASLKASGKFLVGYAGSHGIANSLDVIIDAAALLMEHNVVFVLVGNGPEKERLIRKSSEKGVNNIFFLPPIKKKSIPDFLRRMDILFIGWQKNPLYRFGISPNKLLDYMMSAKPIIHAVKAANDIVSDSHCGLSIAPEDAPAVAAAVKSLTAMSQEEQRQMGLRGKNYVVAHHNYADLARKFIKTISG